MKTSGFNIVEQEVDEIRLKIYEKTKNMTFEERSNYYTKRRDELAVKYGLTFVKSGGG